MLRVVATLDLPTPAKRGGKKTLIRAEITKKTHPDKRLF